MHLRYLAFLSVCCALPAFAQQPGPIVLPADKTDADITLPFSSEIPKAAKANVLPLTDSKGAPFSPQPVIADPVLAAREARLHLSKIYFWGEARLRFQIPPGPLNTYTLQRGPALASSDVLVERRNPAQLWLYNFDTQPLTVRWRVESGSESVCGIEPDGQPRRDCASADKWSEVTLGPARSDFIAFATPDWWFNPWKIFCGDVRQALLELRFGTADAAPLVRMPLKLHLDSRVSDGWWLPSWVGPAWIKFQSLLWVTFWVTLGAVLLMMAQVMIPNFQKSLRMESQIESMQARLRAIGSGVGDNRLYIRSRRELDSVSFDLAMGQAATKFRFLSKDRLALAGNTAEVNRIATLVPRIEARIRLMERLDALQPAALDTASGDVPPSLCWVRARQLRKIQMILSGQVITEADEKTASASLDMLADNATALKDVSTELEKRIAGIRKQLADDPWKTKAADFIKGLNGCAELLAEKPPTEPVPEGSLTIDQLIFRDVAAVRLEIVCQMIAIEQLLIADTKAKDDILKKLQSDDPAKLDEARVAVLKLSQRVSEEDVETAVKTGMWDAYYEPETVTDQDVLRSSFVFRNKDINRSAARNAFQCYWRISDGELGPAPKDDIYESGWEAEFIPRPNIMDVTPEIYGPDGVKVPSPLALDESKNKSKDKSKDKSAGKDKGWASFPVGASPPHGRLLRGLIDALITAVVPVLSVAVTELTKGETTVTTSIYNLVLLGFSSQAIRAVVIPDPASATPAPPPAKTTAADTHA